MLKHLQARDDWSEKSLGAKGFTLVELLVVIVILGILAAVVVFAVGGIRDRGQDSACSAEKKTAETALEAFYAETGEYPAANGWAQLLTDDPTGTPVKVKLLREEPTNFTLNGGGVIVGKGDCV